MNVYTKGIGLNPLTATLGAYLVSSAYTYSFLDTTLSDVPTLGDPTGLTRTGSTTTGTIKYDPTDPIMSGATSGTANAIVVYDRLTDELVYYVPTSTLTLGGANVQILIDVTDGLIQLTVNLTPYDWTVQKFNALDGSDVNPTHSVASLPTDDLTFSNGILICPFSKVDTGEIACYVPNPIVYDKLLEEHPTAEDRNIAHSKGAIVATDFDEHTLFVCSFSVVDTGEIAIANRLPTVFDTTATWDATLVGRPNIRAVRSVGFSGVTITLEETIPTGYEVQLDEGIAPPTDYGAFSELDTIGNIDLPYTRGGLTLRTNYKYQARYVVTGNIDATPVTVKGAIGQRQYTRGKNQTL